MRATCPACSTGYEVPDGLAGRSLRCAACGAVFRAPGEPPAAVEAAPAPAAVEAVADQQHEKAAAPDVAPAPPDAGRLTLASAGSPSAAPRLAWAASLVALAVLLLALHAFRAEIAAAWPPMLRLYRALGLL
jgi:predicted Zn finger-like uncharacterized protein